MAFTWLKNWFRGGAQAEENRALVRPVKRPTFRPTLESLEDRLAPALAFSLVGSQITLWINTRGTIGIAATGQGYLYNGNDFIGPGGGQESLSFEQNGVGPARIISEGGSAFPVTVVNTSSGNTLSATATTTIFGTPTAGLQMERIISFQKNSNHIRMILKLTNNSSTTFYQVGYQDQADIDQSLPPASGVLTSVEVDNNGKLAMATLPNGMTFVFASKDSRFVGSAIGLGTTGHNNDPFGTINAPDFGPDGPNNEGISMAINLGDIPAHQSRTVEFANLSDPDIASARNDYNQGASLGYFGFTQLSGSLIKVYRPLRYIYDAASRTYSGDIEITNIGNQPFAQGLTVVLRNLPAGVTLLNATGTTGGGSPYFSLPTTSLGADQSVRIHIIFRDPLNAHISTFFAGFPIDVWAGIIDASVMK